MRARDEEPEPTTQESMFNFVRLSDGGPARVESARSEVDLVASLGKLVQGTSAAGRLGSGRARRAMCGR